MDEKNKSVEIIPSIASADQLIIAEEIRRIGKWKKLHIDIEDGNFVPNITFGTKMMASIARIAEQELDVHLLANHPEQYFQEMQKCGIKKVAVHLETLRYPLDILNQIKKLGMIPGLALNFMTPAEMVLPFVNAFDYVIVMTAEPDNNGQMFYPPMLNKIKRLCEILPQNTEIWADGGINEKNMNQVLVAGANTLIMGRCVFQSENPYRKLNELCKKF